MSLVALLGISVAASLAVILLRGRRSLAWVVGLVGLTFTAVVALGLQPGAIELGRTLLQITAFARSLVATIAVGAMLLGLVAAAASAPPTVTAALLAGIAAIAIAVAAPDPLVGLWAVVAGAVAAIGIGLLPEGSIDRPGPSADALRAVGASGALGIFGIALAAPPIASPAPDAGILGLAYVAVAVALGIRLAAVPVHRWAARLADTTPAPLAAATLVWLPVALALVVIGWQAGPVAATGVDLAPERIIVVVVGLGTVLLATVAALVQDDLGHATAYLIIADAGLGFVAFGIADAAAWAAAQTWLLVLAATKTGLVAWCASMEAAYGTRWLPDLEGWARRSPGLGAALALVAIATVGWPGSAALAARLDLVTLAIAGPTGVIVGAALIAVGLPYARVLLVGLRRPSGVVASSPSGRPRKPTTWEVTRAAPALDRVRAAARDVRSLWSLDRRPVAAGAVVALALLAAVVSAGAVGRGSAGGGIPPAGSPSPVVSPGPTAGPSSTPAGSPSASPDASPSASPDLSPSATPNTSPSASPTASPTG